MGFKMKGPSMHSGTASHASALKIKSVEARKQEVAAAGQASASGEASASPAKETDWAAMHAKANKKYNRYKNLTTEEYKKEALRQSAHYKKTGKWDAGGVYNHDGSRVDGGTKKVDTKPTETDMGNTIKDKDAPRKDKYADKYTSNVKRRKDGSIKKETEKTVYKDELGKEVEKDKVTYRKDGTKKKEVSKSKDTGAYGKNKSKTKTKTKYDKEGNVKRSKTVEVKGGRRTVTKTDKEGNVTTKSKRTLKGILTGKGKKKKEEETSSSPAKYKKSPAKVAPLVAMAGKAIAGKVAGKVVDKAMNDKKE